MYLLFPRLSKAVKTSLDANQLFIPISSVAYLTSFSSSDLCLGLYHVLQKI